MTTKEFLQIERRLLPSFPGFVINGRLMLVHPLDHTLRGFHFDPSAFGKKDFYIATFFMPLYIPTEYVHLTFGHRINRRQGWRADQTDLDVALKSEMQLEAPFLLSLKTADDVAKALDPFVRPNEAGYVNPHCYEALAYSLIRAGQTRRALSVLDILLKSANSRVAWEREIAARADLMRARLAKGPNEAERQLVAWEDETIHNLDLQNFIIE